MNKVTFEFTELEVANGEALRVPNLTPVMLHCRNSKRQEFYTQGYYVAHNRYFLNYANGLIENLSAKNSKNKVLGWCTL